MDTGSAQSRTYVIVATWAEDGAPVSGARVLALSKPLDPQRELIAVPSWVQGEAATDDVGRAVFGPISTAAPACIWVLENHAEPVMILDPSGEKPNTVLLRRAPLISGTVRTTDGAPVPGIGIRAWPLDIPGSALEDLTMRRSIADGTLPVREATTDSAGNFSLGSWGNVSHMVRISGGWGIAGVEADSASADRLTWQPGQGPVAFVVEPLRIAQVRFLDNASGETLTLASGLVEVAFDRAVARIWSRENDKWHFSGPMGSVSGPTSDEEPSILRYVVRLRGTPDQDARIDATFNPAGFQTTRANIPLTSPESAPRAPVTLIRLVRRDAEQAGPCVLVCSGVEAPEGLDLGPGAVLALRGVQGTAGGGFFIGRRINPSTWEFRGLPEGRFSGRLSLGFLAESDPLEVTLNKGVDARSQVRFNERGWVSFECRDEAGHLVYDAAFLNLYSAEGGQVKSSIMQLAGSVTGVRLDPDSGTAKSGVINLAPGSYIFTCFKPGYEPAKVEVEVKAGQLARASIRLTRQNG